MRQNKVLGLAIATALSMGVTANSSYAGEMSVYYGGWSSPPITADTTCSLQDSYPTFSSEFMFSDPDPVLDGGTCGTGADDLDNSGVDGPAASSLGNYHEDISVDDRYFYAVYTVEATLTSNFLANFELSNGATFGGDGIRLSPTLLDFVAHPSGTHAAATYSSGGNAGDSEVTFLIQPDDNTFSKDGSHTLFLRYTLDNLDALQSAGEEIELTVSLFTSDGSIQIDLPSIIKTVATSARGSNINLSSEIGTVYIDVSNFTGSTIINETTVALGAVYIGANSDTIKDDGSQWQFNTDNPAPSATLTIINGNFSASVEGTTGAVFLDMDENGALDTTDRSADSLTIDTATWELDSDDLANIIAAGGVDIVIMADGTTEINDFSEPPEATLVISYSGSNNKDTFTKKLRHINGTKCSTESVTITPATLDFGSEAVGNSLALTANVRSQGCEDLQIDTIDFAGNDATEFSVQDKECYDGEWQGKTFTACQFNIVFSPTVAGDKEANFNVVFTDTEVQAATMPLQATAVDTGSSNISISLNPIDFGTIRIGEGTTPQTLTVENTGDVNLQFEPITLTGENAAAFSFYGDCSSKTFMRPGEQCQLSAQFIPQSEGDKQADLNLSSISTVALIGQAAPLLDCAEANITIQTVANGSWDSADSWNVDRIPQGSDVVKINSGHTITGSADYLNVKTLCIETDAMLESLDDLGTGLQIKATDYIGNKGTIRGQDGALYQPGASIHLSTGSWKDGKPFYNEGSIIAGHGGDGEQQGGHGGMIHISGGGIINTPNENGNGGIIQAGNGGDISGTQSGQAGDGGRITMWGSEFLRHQGDIRITTGHGGNCHPNASGFQTGGNGGNVGLNADSSIHLQGTFQAGNGSTNCNANGTAGVVYIDPVVISISGVNTTISGGEVTINGANTIELTDLSGGAIRATGDITLAVGEDHVIDMRGNTGQFLQAGGQVQILADEIVLDEEVKLSQVIQATNTMVGPSRVLRDVSLTVAGKLSGEPGETVFINVTLSNNGPETDTYTLSLTDSQGWALTPLPTNAIEIEGLGGINFELAVTLSANPGERNIVTITATSQADPEVKATTEVQVTVAGGSENRSGSSGMKPLRTNMTVFVEIYGKGQGHVISEPAGIDCEPTHCQAVDYAQDATGIECDPNYCSAVVDTATQVTLTAIPDSGSVFKGWGGHKDCGDGQLFMIGNKLCIAFFGQLED